MQLGVVSTRSGLGVSPVAVTLSRRTLVNSHVVSFNSSQKLSYNRNTIQGQFNPMVNAIETNKIHLSNLENLIEKQQTSLPDKTLESATQNSFSEKKSHHRAIQGLNLAGLFLNRTKSEEISPRNLNKLQRLLSNLSENSPKNSIRHKWREYHGSNDWIGLIEPLDENLRREIIRYGEFVQKAYEEFHSNPDTNEDEEQTRRVMSPDKSYKVTKNLYATSSVGLPSWVDDVAPEFGWMTQRSSWIGYVAVCDDMKEIKRMGRRDIVIALRGTATILEWSENLRNFLVKIPEDAGVYNGDHGDPKVECGFWSLLTTEGTNLQSLSSSILDEVQRLVKKYEGEELSITVTGHSLGAALALLAANEISFRLKSSKPTLPIAVVSFGGPRVGNRAFTHQAESNGVKALRIVNTQDVITRVPGLFANEATDQKMRESKIPGVAKIFDKMPWSYFHMGTELRVDSKSSPYLKPNPDPGCCHDLEAYLHLVDGFTGTNHPFRPNAKRSLLRLLSEQGSNVKKLYVKKALTLSLDRIQSHTGPVPSCLPSPS